ncbi:lipin Ned1, partial [Teratosphaeriaceae sp. CCFEE 6253]
LDLLSLNTYKTAYGGMREIVDHYFPPVGLLVGGGGEEFTDFSYWREKPRGVEDFTDSESEGDEDPGAALVGVGRKVAVPGVLERSGTEMTGGGESVLSEDEAGDAEADEMLESYPSEQRLSLQESLVESLTGQEGEEGDAIT